MFEPTEEQKVKVKEFLLQCAREAAAEYKQEVVKVKVTRRRLIQDPATGQTKIQAYEQETSIAQLLAQIADSQQEIIYNTGGATTNLGLLGQAITENTQMLQALIKELQEGDDYEDDDDEEDDDEEEDERPRRKTHKKRR